ncbi:MAG: tetratricopeptide repeat protein [Desulfuromonadaceae bacterium]|nr:tetratricopeptide repeat protein [Desulfuromonadaceae bacterium]
MSLLADLLSKTKNIGSSSGKDVPPTLARAQSAGAASPWLKRRYIIMSVLAIFSIIIGIFLPSQLKHLPYFRHLKKAQLAPPQPFKMPLPPMTVPDKTKEQIAEEAKKTVAAEKPDKTAEPETVSNKQTSSAAKVKKTFRKPISKIQHPSQKEEAMFQDKIAHYKPATAKHKTVEPEPAKIDTNARGALLYAARSSEQSGDWRGALASYRAVLDIDPDNYRVMSNSAAAYNKLGMYPDGERQARRALAIKPDYVPALINAAIACSSQNNNKDALAFFAAAAAAEPDNKSLAVNLGIMQERAGNLNDALATYRRAAASGDPQALFGMARVNEQTGHKSEAITAYRIIMSQKNASPSLKREVKNRLLGLEQ